MTAHNSKKWPHLVMLISLSSLLMISCGSSGDSTDATQPVDTQETPRVVVEDTVITIGNLSDLTGVSANAQSIINYALEDLVEYYNDNDLIPGVELKVITFDGQFDPSRDIPGYEWLRERDADLLVSCVPPVVVSLKRTVDQDEFVMFVASGNLEDIMPPGYVFSLGIVPQHCAYTLTKWIAESHWNYKKNGPAKIGGAAWTDTFSVKIMEAIEAYAEAHPEQFEFVGSYLSNFSFVWDAEIEALKDCDYVFVPTPMHIFVRDYINAGHETTFIGTDAQAAFMGLIDDGDLWDEIDGMLFVQTTQYWTGEGPIIDLTRELLFENRADEAENIIRSGTGYLTMTQWYQMLEIIKDAVETVGPQNFDSEALYSAATSYSEVLDGIERYSYGETKRFSPNYFIIQEARAEERNLFMADPDWLPVEMEP